jgi:uncharacterized cupin superfamily protein
MTAALFSARIRRQMTELETAMAATRIQRFEPFGPRGTAAASGFVRWPDIPAADLDSGNPVQRGHYYLEDSAHGLSAGVWDCTAMTTKPAPYPVNEFMIVLEGEVTIIDARAGAVTIEAGESFVIPKGLACQWHQPGYMRKFFVIFDDASGAAPRDPAALRVLRPDPRTALAPCAGPAPELLLGAAPQQHEKLYFADLTGQWTVGVWDSTPYRRKTIPFPRHELMHILDGEVTITEDGHPPQAFKAGDTFFVPLGTPCDWTTTGYVRKIYCIFQPKAAAVKATTAKEAAA